MTMFCRLEPVRSSKWEGWLKRGGRSDKRYEKKPRIAPQIGARDIFCLRFRFRIAIRCEFPHDIELCPCATLASDSMDDRSP